MALLARLGVDLHHEGRGLGAALLADVISRTAQIGSEVGCRGLLVHAESASARAFCLHLIPEFEPSSADALHLVRADEGDPPDPGVRSIRWERDHHSARWSPWRDSLR
ncbi:MAG: hypothetical protein QUV07_07240 [Cyanobium sp. CZS 25K]|nr:hypothetical protein [Cyanobium sp. CZS25K]